MYTSLVLLALTGFTSSAENVEAPSWQTDYSLAKKQGEGDKKPVAVFIGSGKEGWDKLVRKGSLGKEHLKALANSYVCLYLDTTTPDGKRMAKLLDINNGLGLVISDHTGAVMAFHHEGDLASADLAKYLTRFADPERVVRTTETNPGTQSRSYYYPPAPVYQPVSSGRSC